MKKSISIIAALAMLATTAMSVSATEITDQSDPKTASAEITTNIQPTYVISIPEDTAITFNTLSTDLGEIKATAIKREPNKQVTVTATAGKLLNQADNTKEIEYALMSGETAFTSVGITDTLTATPLTADITQTAWDESYAGAYKATVTFTISYDDITV